MFLGQNPISWSSKKQKTIARSSTKSKYCAVASTTVELSWIQSLLGELRLSLPQPTIYCDNAGTTYFCVNPVYHSHMKHIAIDFHFVRHKVQNGDLRVSHVSSQDQLVDAFTKPLSCQRLSLLHPKIGVVNENTILWGQIKYTPKVTV